MLLAVHNLDQLCLISNVKHTQLYEFNCVKNSKSHSCACLTLPCNYLKGMLNIRNHFHIFILFADGLVICWALLSFCLNRHEASLVENIAQHIHRKLVPKLPSCTENLVGIVSKVEEVNKFLGMGLNDVRFIGIWGMGGIGKSTIARAVYEAIRCEFELTCFLENVRDISETNGLVHLQRQLQMLEIYLRQMV
jgi:hypothetical protein